MREAEQAQAERASIVVAFTEISFYCVCRRLVLHRGASAGEGFERVAFEAVPALSVILLFFLLADVTIW